jgi:hypothetical protein
MNKLTIFLIYGFIWMLISCNENSSNQQQKESGISIDDSTSGSKFNGLVPAGLQRDSSNLLSLIPPGYELHDTLTGNLNLDSITDILIVAKKLNEQELAEKTDSTVKRLLLIATGSDDGTFIPKRQSENIILCAGCGGAMGDPFAAMVIKNGFFSIEHYGGSSWRWERTTTFRYSPKDNDWLFHKDGKSSFHAAEPERVTETLKTVKETGRVFFSDFNIYADQ